MTAAFRECLVPDRPIGSYDCGAPVLGLPSNRALHGNKQTSAPLSHSHRDNNVE